MRNQNHGVCYGSERHCYNIMPFTVLEPIMKLLHSLVFSALYLFSSNTFAQADIPIAQFDTESLTDWQSKSFVGKTHYEIVELDGRRVLKAYSNKSASGLAKELKIDLKKTPYLNWSWRIENSLRGLDEQTKPGDDYAARIYVVKSGGWKIWQTKALNYVWSSNQQTDRHWDNAFAGNKAKMLAVRGQQDAIKNWVSEKRNVYQDLIDLFGDKGSNKENEDAYRFIDAVAIMTDTDNSQYKATAYYGDIYFSEK